MCCVCVWCAGAIDDECFEGVSFSRIIHISCSHMQRWYELPMDGLPRLIHAG